MMVLAMNVNPIPLKRMIEVVCLVFVMMKRYCLRMENALFVTNMKEKLMIIHVKKISVKITRY